MPGYRHVVARSLQPREGREARSTSSEHSPLGRNAAQTLPSTLRHRHNSRAKKQRAGKAGA